MHWAVVATARGSWINLAYFLIQLAASRPLLQFMRRALGGQAWWSGGVAPERRQGNARSNDHLIHFFCDGATPLGLEPAVMALPIPVELNPTPPKTSGDGSFEPAVIGGAGVVYCCIYLFKSKHNGICYFSVWLP